MVFDVLISWKVGEERMELLESKNIESTATYLSFRNSKVEPARGTINYIYTDVLE